MILGVSVRPICRCPQYKGEKWCIFSQKQQELLQNSSCCFCEKIISGGMLFERHRQKRLLCLSEIMRKYIPCGDGIVHPFSARAEGRKGDVPRLAEIAAPGKRRSEADKARRVFLCAETAN